MQEYNVKLDGSSDLSRTIEIMFKNFRNFIQKEIVNVVAWRLARSVEESLNQMLMRNSSGEIVDLSSSKGSVTNSWNVTLLRDPIFEPTYVSFVLDGSFYQSNGHKSTPQ